MTTAFYPVGTWQQPEGVYETMYQQMSNPGNQVRSDYTAGYAGHQPEVKFIFGYSTPGPVLRATREPTIEPDFELPSANDRHAMRTKVLKEVSSRVDKPPARKSTSVPVEMSRKRHTSRASDHKFPKTCFSMTDPSCPAAFEIRNPTSTANPKPTLYRSSSMATYDRLRLTGACAVDRGQPVNCPQGGTGYDACAGIVNTWWPKERKAADPVKREVEHNEKWTTSTARVYNPHPFHRPLFLM